MATSPVRRTATGVEVQVWVVPGAARTGIQGTHGERLKVTVAVPAEGGQANRAVTELLEEVLGGRASLESGMRNRAKVFSVAGVDARAARRKLGV